VIRCCFGGRCLVGRCGVSMTCAGVPFPEAGSGVGSTCCVGRATTAEEEEDDELDELEAERERHLPVGARAGVAAGTSVHLPLAARATARLGASAAAFTLATSSRNSSRQRDRSRCARAFAAGSRCAASRSFLGSIVR